MALIAHKQLAEGLKVAYATTVVRTRHLATPRHKDSWKARSFCFRHKSIGLNGGNQLKGTGDFCDMDTLPGSCLLCSIFNYRSEGITLSSGMSSLFLSLLFCG